MQGFHDNWPEHTDPLLTKALSGQEERLRGLKEDVRPYSSRHKELCLHGGTALFPQARGFWVR